MLPNLSSCHSDATHPSNPTSGPAGSALAGMEDTMLDSMRRLEERIKNNEDGIATNKSEVQTLFKLVLSLSAQLANATTVLKELSDARA